MLSCKQAQELVSRGEGVALSPWERMSLRLHLLMCRLCRRAARQMRLIDRTVRGLSAAAASREDPALSPEARERIRKTLRDS